MLFSSYMRTEWRIQSTKYDVSGIFINAVFQVLGQSKTETVWLIWSSKKGLYCEKHELDDIGIFHNILKW